LETLGKLVAEVRDVELPLEGFRTIFDAEIYEYHEPMIQQSPERYDPRTLFRLKNCASISATDYIRERRRLGEFRRKVGEVFEKVDVIITPTTPVPAPKIAELEALAVAEVRPFEVKYLLRNTAPFSVLFWPTTSVPCGFTRDKLPVGMQISARPGADLLVLRLADAYQQATEWHQQSPSND
jgi:aspartyl-tRNA(Asn)/glutamyl-tRNA(Gln) amidotransferase subunit A